MNVRHRRFIATVLVATAAVPAQAATCSAESPARRIALLELYTSEGCNSCPPTDRWVSGLPARGFSPSRVVTLAFHVDYWNYLGWPDPFASAHYSERQRIASRRNGARVVYTPQLLLNGTDYRRATLLDDFGDRLDVINRQSAPARISLQLQVKGSNGLDVRAHVDVADATARARAHAFLALYENNLSNQVTAGENRGKRLRHDFVVRDLAGPFAVGSSGGTELQRRFLLAPEWKTGDLHVAAFVQSERSGDVLQALAVPLCR